MVKLKWHLAQEKLAELEKPVFTAQDLRAVFGASDRAVQGFLQYNVLQKKLLRLRRGYYAFKNNFPQPFAVANILYRPSYISLESALAFYTIIPETVYAVTSVTTKTTREFSFDNHSFIYHTIKQAAFTGYILKNKILLAQPEKALADYCYFVALGKKEENDRVDISSINKRELWRYLRLFDSEKTIQIAKNWLKI